MKLIHLRRSPQAVGEQPSSPACCGGVTGGDGSLFRPPFLLGLVFYLLGWALLMAAIYCAWVWPAFGIAW